MYPAVSVTVGKVVSTKDPDGLGRVQVQLQGYNSTVQVWLRMTMPYASTVAGFVFLPEVDDEVLVLRGTGDNLDGMFIIGALYNGARTPVYTNADGENITKQIQTRSGNHVVFTDKDGEEAIEIKTKAGNIITMTDKSGTNGFAINNADGTIKIKRDMNGADITVANGKNATVTVQGDTTVNGTGNVTIKGGMNVNVEAGINLTCKGAANASLEAGAQLAVKGGAQVSVEAPMIKIAGGLVQIN